MFPKEYFYMRTHEETLFTLYSGLSVFFTIFIPKACIRGKTERAETSKDQMARWIWWEKLFRLGWEQIYMWGWWLCVFIQIKTGTNIYYYDVCLGGGWCGFNLQLHLISGSIMDSSKHMPFSTCSIILSMLHLFSFQRLPWGQAPANNGSLSSI